MVVPVKINQIVILLINFSRPHTVLGTIFSITGLYFLSNDNLTEIFSLNLLYLIAVLLVTILGNVYITGLNQISDISIDKINKPYLPLVSGELTVKQAELIAITCFVSSLVFAFIINIYLFLTIAISLLIGSLYSLDPFRLKKYPFLASLSIITVRGIVVNIGIFLTFTSILHKSLVLNYQILYLTLFISFFTISIALLKDIPDVMGDKEFKIDTFSILFGKKSTFYFAVGILITLYILSIIIGFMNNLQSSLVLISLLHIIILSFIIFKTYQTNYEETSSIKIYYFSIWKIFYIEYLTIPLAFVL